VVLFFTLCLLHRLCEPLDEDQLEAIGREAALGEVLLQLFDIHAR